MTHQQDGNASNKPTAYPEMHISTFCKTNKESASFVKDILTRFVPEDILQSITITEQVVSEEPSVTRVTIDYSGT